jgi:Malic enzyme, NAD binding domain
MATHSSWRLAQPWTYVLLRSADAGLAWGAFLAETGEVTDGMLMAAAESLSSLIAPKDLARGSIYPRLSDIRC